MGSWDNTPGILTTSTTKGWGEWADDGCVVDAVIVKLMMTGCGRSCWRWQETGTSCFDDDGITTMTIQDWQGQCCDCDVY